MANINVKFNGKEYLLSCEDGQEEHLHELAHNLNDKFEKLKNDLGNIGENKLLLITAIKVMDEYFETKKKVDAQKKELQDLKEKFKELKSLVYQYKDNKYSLPLNFIFTFAIYLFLPLNYRFLDLIHQFFLKFDLLYFSFLH